MGISPTNVRDPGIDIVPVTPNDAADLTDGLCRALLIGTGGTIKITTAAGHARTVVVPAGLLPVQVWRVWAAGLTAANISALY